MPIIRSFRIEGLAGRTDVCSATLNAYVNVCFGANGSGKTSLLRIFHSALENDGDLVREVPFTRAEMVIHSYAAKVDFTYSIDKTPPAPVQVPQEVSFGEEEVQIARPRRRQKRLTWQITPADKARAWFHKYLPTTRLYTPNVPPQWGLAQPELSEEFFEAQFASILTRLWKDYSSDVAREVNKAQEAGLARILQGVISKFESAPDEEPTDPAKAYEAVSNFLSRRKMTSINREEFLRRYNTEQQLQSVAKDIEAVEREISEATAPREAFRTLVGEMFVGGKSLNISGKDIEVLVNEKPISLATLSSGEKHLLRILVDTLSVGSSIILIDEPELSMHVDWQRRLIASMKILNSNAQMIFATHSPEIMADLPDSDIFRI